MTTNELIDSKYKTQRAEDKAYGRPLDKQMTEDPKLRGLPLFLQIQNRRPMTAEQQARWDAMRAKDPRPTRIKDWRKPKSLSDEEWRKFKTEETAKKEKKTQKRLAKLKEKQPPKKPKVIGYKGHLAGSRKEQVHKLFDEKGAGAALRLASKLGLKDGTARSWTKGWAKFQKKEEK